MSLVVGYRSEECEDTITLPERRVAAGMQQDGLQHTLGVQDKLSAALVRNPLLSDIMLADQSQSGRDGCAGNRDPTTAHNAAELRFVRQKREEKEFRKLNPKRRSWLRAGAALAARVGSKTDVADTRPQSPCLHARSEAEEIASTWHAQPARVLILCRAQTLKTLNPTGRARGQCRPGRTCPRRPELLRGGWLWGAMEASGS